MASKKLYQRFMDLKIQDKIFICFVLISMVSVLGIGISSYYKSSDILGDKTSRYNVETVQQLSTGVDYTLQRIDELSGILAFDQRVQQVLNTELDTMTERERIAAVNQIESIMITNYNSQIMRSIEIYGRNGLVVKVPSSFSDRENEGKSQQYIEEASIYRGKTKWINNACSEGLLRAVREINELQTATKPLGTVIISLKYETVTNLLRNVNFDRSGSVLLIDEKGRTVTPANPFDRLFEDEEFQQFIAGQTASFIQTIEGEDYLVSYLSSAYSGWTTIGIISVDKLYEDNRTVRDWIIVVTLIILLFAFVLARVFAQTITNPIKRMLNPMKKVQMGDMNVSFPVESKDEIGILSTGVNHMVSQIHTLVEDAYKGRILLQQSEFKALQAQINPHFLYNTLESINWMAKMNGVDQICRMVSALGDLMRISISTDKEYITIEEEMKYIGDYLYIQKSRFGERIAAEIHIDDELKSVVIPKLILQPIVENALLHGVQVKKGKGNIDIRGRRLDESILFEVEDDGIGMTPKQIAKLLADNGIENPQAKGSGIGVRNVHQRIRFIYGMEYGVTIKSQPGEGTTVQIRIAARLPMEE
ncbi:MAG TPA: sensor histidine kinase [Paenibacillus sp.]|uniref:cache domain-containing sensor histidine kinase n=1 Tax=Paenibacillus sp. TaxID=58172 RepID=UPI002CC8AFF1|nr:sensor histidine kinase [Paenibacillus sp.]HUC91386.1 sensor histidine kinase [Paenibacillus sp.]